MSRILVPILTAISVVFVGCASTHGSAPSGTGSPSTVAASPEADRLAPAVSVPEPSKHKIVLAMTGPKNVVEAKDWTDFKREWRETFGEHAKQAGVAYSFSDAEPKPTGEDGTILLVDVADYRLVGIGARIFFGVMTGNAFIDARIRYASLRDGVPVGERQYNTTSSAWGGIFSKVTPQQVDSIASNVFLDFVPAK